MIRYTRYAFLAVVAVVLVTLAIANRQMVELKLLPEGLDEFTGFTGTLSLPLFAVIFAGLALGLLVGYALEWLREHKIRREANQNRREVGKLEREVKRLKQKRETEGDDVLALLEESEAR